MSTETQTFLFADPETGEVSELDAEEREALTVLLATKLVAAERAAAEREGLRVRLALLMDREAPVLVEGWAVTLEAAPTPPRAVIERAVREHAETLAPIGMAPVPQPPKPQADKMPGVGAFTSAKGKADLARVGLSPDTFVHTPLPREPVVKVYPPVPEPDGPG